MQQTSNVISDKLFKLKQSSTQVGYLSFNLMTVNYAINMQHVINIIDNPEDLALIYLSHMSPPIIGIHYYNSRYIPVLDFSGYQPYNSINTLLILSTNQFKKDNIFGLLVNNANEILYFKQKNLIKNKAPFDNLLPAYFYAKHDNAIINLIDIHDLSNQIDS